MSNDSFLSSVPAPRDTDATMRQARKGPAALAVH
jgi:hypothetical protein